MSVTPLTGTNTAGATQVEPTGAREGDILFAIMNGTTAMTGPTGWTQLGSQLTNSFSEVGGVWWIVRGQSAPSYVWTGTVDGGAVVGYRGASKDFTFSQSANNSNVCPSVSGFVGDRLVCLYLDSNAPSLTAPAGMTLDATGSFDTGASVDISSAGAQGTKTFGSTVQPMFGISLVLRPLFPIPTITSPPRNRRRGFPTRRSASPIQDMPLGNLGPVPNAFGPYGADFDTRLMANPRRGGRGKIFAPVFAPPVVNVNFPRPNVRDVRPLARAALRHGQMPDVPKPQTVAPPPYPPYRIKAANRIGIPRYVRRKPGESLRTFAPYQPVYPLPIAIRNRDRRTWRRYVNRVQPPWPQAPAPFYPTPLKARIKPITPRWRRTRLEFTPNDQALAPYFGVPTPRPPAPKRVFRAKSKIFAAPADQIRPVERRVTRRAVPVVRRRGLVAPLADSQPTLVRLGKRFVGLPTITRRTRSTSVPERRVFSPGASIVPARRRSIPPRKTRQQPFPQSPGYTNPLLVSRGRPETPFRAGVALRRGREVARGAWNNPIAPVFVPKWARTQRMQGLRARLGRGQIIAPVIQVVNDVVYSIRPAPEVWRFGFTVDSWQYHDDNDNWMFWFAGG